jgi:hypothetical protein
VGGGGHGYERFRLTDTQGSLIFSFRPGKLGPRVRSLGFTLARPPAGAMCVWMVMRMNHGFLRCGLDISCRLHRGCGRGRRVEWKQSEDGWVSGSGVSDGMVRVHETCDGFECECDVMVRSMAGVEVGYYIRSEWDSEL